jgi:4-amino-4-deoxy-L-arabinose transferase-like glycosyltransferase
LSSTDNLSSSVQSRTRLHLFVLISLSIVVWVCTAGLWDLWGPDEARYVQIAKELLGRGNWFKLTVFGELYDQKPPLPFWIMAIVLKIYHGQISEWALRMPSVLSAIGCVIMSYYMGRRIGGERLGFLSGLVLLATPTLVDGAPTAELNLQFTGFITLACFMWVMRERGKPMNIGSATLMWAALTAAFFVKGPLCLFVMLSAIFTECIIRRGEARVLDSRIQYGLPVLLLLVAGWLLLQRSIAGGEFVEKQVEGQTIQRMLHGDHSEPPWYYLPRLFIMFPPWIFFFIPAIVKLYRQRKSIAPELLAIFGWFVFPFILLSIVSGKRQAYLLPLTPPFALISAWYIEKFYLVSARAMKVKPLLILALAIVAIALLGLGVAGILMPLRFTASHVNLTPGIILRLGLLALVFAALAILCSRARTPYSLVHYMAALVLCLALTDFVAFHPAKNARVTAKLFDHKLEEILKTESSDYSVGGVARAGEPEYHVYGQYRVRPFSWRTIKTMPKPKIAVLLAKDAPKYEKLLNKSGYERFRQQFGAGENVLILRRK